MKSALAIATSLLLVASPGAAFSSSSSFSGSQISTPTNNAVITMEYIPSGVSKEQWRKMKEAEAAKKKGNLGKTGITSFKSRSFAEWQKAGGKNLFPVDPKSVKDAKDIPYMQRPGGKPDDSDLKKNKGGGFFGKKQAPKKDKAAPAEEKKTNWWTL